MKLSKEKENMGLPEYIKFGLELEVENVNYNKITPLVKEKNWHTDKDPSLTDSGVECVSPVLTEKENESVWGEVEQICKNIKENPYDEEKGAYTDHTCGGHIHFDSTILQQNPEAMKNFLRLWAESEELVYKMCNDKNDPIRPGAINTSGTTLVDVCKTALQSPLPKQTEVKSLRDLIKIARETAKNVGNNLVNANRKINIILNDNLVSRNGMAAPIGQKIQKQIEKKNLKLGKPRSMIYREAFVKTKLTPERYTGLNLTNLGNKKKNTIEFRMSNGTINPQTIKENVFLYASLIKTAVDLSQGSKVEEAQKLYDTNVTEEEKVNNFLNLIMDRQEDRQVYKDRWESVKDAPVFKSEGTKMFNKNRFQKSEYEKISDEIPAQNIKRTYDFIANLKNRMILKEENGLEH